MDQLLKVRQGTAELRQKISEVNIALQTRGSRLTEKVDQDDMTRYNTMLMDEYSVVN